MKKFLLFFLVMTVFASYGWAQQVVSGSVKSAEDGISLPGVAIVIVGTTQGTVSDGSGNYRLEVPAGSRLKFSYVGYQSQEIEVGSQSVINVSLAADVTQLSEIVVTALSVERDTKTLAYSVTSVEGESFTEARENNLANALEGRIAGVNVSRNAGGPAGSSRVIIRGNKTLLGGFVRIRRQIRVALNHAFGNCSVVSDSSRSVIQGLPCLYLVRISYRNIGAVYESIVFKDLRFISIM